MRRPLGWALLLPLLAPASAWAGIADSVGLGPRASALGGSMAARSGDLSALHHNPAGLRAPADGAGFMDASFGVVWAKPLLHVDGVDGAAAPDTVPVDDTLGLTMGLRLDPGARWGVKGWALGVGVWTPTHLFAWKIHPDDQAQWLLHTDRTQHISVRAGLAREILPGLVVGAGLRVMFDTETNTRAVVTDVRRGAEGPEGDGGIEVATRMGEDVTVFGRTAPVLGARWDGEAMSLGVAWRGELYVDDWGRTRIIGAPGLGDAGYAHRFSHYYEPTEVAFAGALQAAPGLRLSMDATWSRWSEGLTTNHQRLGPGRYGDTLVVAAGASADLGWGVAMMGYRHMPSPFDNFGGPTNLMDNDRHVVSVGVQAPLAEGVRLLASASAQILPERVETKDWRRFESDEELRGNPGAEGYVHGGAVVASALAVEASW